MIFRWGRNNARPTYMLGNKEGKRGFSLYFLFCCCWWCSTFIETQSVLIIHTSLYARTLYAGDGLESRQRNAHYTSHTRIFRCRKISIKKQQREREREKKKEVEARVMTTTRNNKVFSCYCTVLGQTEVPLFFLFNPYPHHTWGKWVMFFQQLETNPPNYFPRL